MFEEVKKYVDDVVEERKLPYLDVIVYKEHKELYRYFNGSNKPVTGKESLCLFSCTKPVTVVSAMKLVEEGKLSLDDEVGKYIPKFYEAYLLDESGNRVPLESPILVRHLFTMSCGIDYGREKACVTEFVKKNPDASTADVAGTFVDSPLHFKPGTKYMYSLCHDVLGAVVEVVSGKNLSEYMKENIFLPLGMKNTFMDTVPMDREIPVSYKITENGFVDDGGDGFRSFQLSKNYYSGGAGLVSTVEDYSLFADALASGGVGKDGVRIIKEETLKMINTLQIEKVDIQNAFTCVQGKDYGYGLGVRVRTRELECGIPVGEFGWDGAAGTYLLVDLKNKISIVIGLNVLEWPKVFKNDHLAIAERVYKEVLKNGN